MKKLFTGLLLAAAALFSVTAVADHHHPRWGYFYTIASDNFELYDGSAIDWGNAGGDDPTSDGISLDFSDTTKIVIEHPGVYLVTYSVSAYNDDENDIEFALRLNDGPTNVPGSLYSAFETSGTGTIQLYGQAIVQVQTRNSTLQLVSTQNYQFLYNINSDNNVTASVLLHRIDPHDD